MTARPSSSGRRWLFVLLGLLSSAGFLALAVGRLDADDVWSALGRAALLPWLPLGVACYLAGQLVRGVRCRLLVSDEARLSTLTATNVVVLGYAVNNILPARLGEIARAGMLSQRSGLPFVQSLSVTLLERVLDGLTMLGLLAATLPLVPAEGWVAATLELGAMVFGLALAGTVVAVAAPDFLLRTVGRIANRFGRGAHDRALTVVSHLVRGVQYLRRPAAALQIGLLSVAVWLLEAGMFLSLLPAFGLPADPFVALLAMTITNLGILLPSSPGFIGPFHYFCMKALTVVGVPEAVGFSYAALVHLSFYLPVTAWGVAILVGWGVRLGAAIERQRQAPILDLPAIQALSVATPSRPPSSPSRLDRALVEALLPLAPDGAGGADRGGVVDDVAVFVRGQLEALPLRLRVLLALGLAAVRLTTWLRYLRSLPALGDEQRRRWVERWAYGSSALGRQLFRAIRANALVAYYEHPEVASASRAPRQDGGPPASRGTDG